MAVIKCKQCGNMCDDSLGECSFCKSSLDYTINVKPKKFANKTYESEYKIFLSISVIFFIVVVFGIVYVAQVNNKASEYKGKSEEYLATHWNLIEENEKLQKELTEWKQRYDIVANDYKELTDSETYKLITENDANISKLTSDIVKLEERKKSINDEIETNKELLAELENKIESANLELKDIESKPIEFSAGEYICGQDFEVGRYLIYDGRSNFFVTGGKTYVNIILGDDPSWGQIEEYVHYFTEGEVIQANSPFKLKKVD